MTLPRPQERNTVVGGALGSASGGAAALMGAIGNTPLVELELVKEVAPDARLFAKLGEFQPRRLDQGPPGGPHADPGAARAALRGRAARAGFLLRQCRHRLRHVRRRPGDPRHSGGARQRKP